MAALHTKNIEYFDLLKQKIVATMQGSYPGINPNIKEWKGQEITDFQEELLKKVNARISEKWFYNHIKKDGESLPRIDVLNFLSKYAGYANWDDFVFKNGKTVTEKPEANEKPVAKANYLFVIIPGAVVLISGLLYLLFMVLNQRTLEFTFYDAYTRKPIVENEIMVQLLHEDDTNEIFQADSTGLVKVKSSGSLIEFVVIAPYYKIDTVNTVVRSFEKEFSIPLYPNDYALVIRSFSEQNVNDWKNRRAYLGNVIDDNAVIYQVLNNNQKLGMALYNKSEFIDRLLVPSGSLKNIEVLETRFQNDKIVLLRFMVKNTEDE